MTHFKYFTIVLPMPGSC